MLGHRLHCPDGCLKLMRFGAEPFFQSRIDSVDEHFASIFRAEYDRVFTVKRDMVMAFYRAIPVTHPGILYHKEIDGGWQSAVVLERE